MRILVIGSSGFIGKNVFNRLLQEGYDAYGISYHNSPTTTSVLDIIDRNEFVKALDKIDPSVVVHCAKMRGGLEYYDEHKQEAADLHINSMRTLSEWVSSRGSKLVAMSTDYVYSGETNNYDEASETKPLSLYGRMMLEGEKVASETPNHAILRPTVVFGYDPGGMNFLMQVLGAREKMKIPIDQVSNPTDINVLVDYTLGVIEKDLRGVYIATGPETIGRFDFTKMVARIFGLDENLFEGVLTKDLGQKSQRPLANGTNSSRITIDLNYKCPSLLESLLKIKKSIK